MSEIPKSLLYTESHEWVSKENDNIVRIGITDHAQELLGDVVYVELPEHNADCQAAEDIAVVESVKAAADIYTPVTGKIIEINSDLDENPSLINSSPYGDGWIMRIHLDDADELDKLLTAESYQQMIEED